MASIMMSWHAHYKLVKVLSTEFSWWAFAVHIKLSWSLWKYSLFKVRITRLKSLHWFLIFLYFHQGLTKSSKSNNLRKLVASVAIENFKEFKKWQLWSWIIFCSSYFVFFFFALCKVESKMSFSIYFFIGLTPVHLNKKCRKWIDIFWVKIWVFSHKTQNFSYKS